MVDSFSVSISSDLGRESSKLLERFFCDSPSHGDKLTLTVSDGIMIGSDDPGESSMSEIFLSGTYSGRSVSSASWKEGKSLLSEFLNAFLLASGSAGAIPPNMLETCFSEQVMEKIRSEDWPLGVVTVA